MQQLGKLTLCCQLQAVILADVGLAPGAPGMPPPKFFIGGGHFHFNPVKPMANPLLMMKISAMPAKVKRTTLVQEVVRIRRNIRTGLPWNITVKHPNNFCQRMKASGYNQNYRYQVLKSGVEGFDKMLEVERSGGRPINRLRSWEEDERQKKKELQKKSGIEQEALTFLCSFPTLQRGSLQRESESWKQKTIRVEASGSR